VQNITSFLSYFLPNYLPIGLSRLLVEVDDTNFCKGSYPWVILCPFLLFDLDTDRTVLMLGCEWFTTRGTFEQSQLAAVGFNSSILFTTRLVAFVILLGMGLRVYGAEVRTLSAIILEYPNFQHLVHCIIGIECHMILNSFLLPIKMPLGVTLAAAALSCHTIMEVAFLSVHISGCASRNFAADTSI